MTVTLHYILGIMAIYLESRHTMSTRDYADLGQRLIAEWMVALRQLTTSEER